MLQLKKTFMPYDRTMKMNPPIKTRSASGTQTIRMFSGRSVRTWRGCLKNFPIPSRLCRSCSSFVVISVNSLPLRRN